MDANTLMESMRTYYAMDLAPAFWAWMQKAHSNGDLASVKAIHDEIAAGGKKIAAGKKEDELVRWTKAMPSTFWLSDTAESLGSITALAEWANHVDRPYNDAAKSEFMGSADLRLIAQAHAMGATVVTREVSAPEAKKIVKIPDVCAAFSIPCSQPFPVYRALGLKLI